MVEVALGKANSGFLNPKASGKTPTIQLCVNLFKTTEELAGTIGAGNNFETLLGRQFMFIREANSDYHMVINGNEDIQTKIQGAAIKGVIEGLLHSNQRQIQIYHRITAEREVSPEKESADIGIKPNGDGLTNLFYTYYQVKKFNDKSLEDRLLKALNDVFYPDIVFDKILIQKNNDSTWEINLEEKGKGRIELSKSGSGIKTVLQVLGSTILLPEYKKCKLDSFVFAFEELENNLHPALQRRLLGYIRELAIRENTCFFITTHSNVIIDQFSRDSNAQIVHVKQEHGKSTCQKVSTYMHSKSIIDDLDFRASDLLQANGIVWLEGPSDRIYFNKWISLWSDDKLKENLHYQCMFYGGRLLSHLTADPELKSWISIININSNGIVLIDSDKNYAVNKINSTKKRIQEEFEKLKMMAWVTKCREIENYIPLATLSKLYNKKLEIGNSDYTKFRDVLEEVSKGEGSKFENSKVLFAEKVTSYMTKADLSKHLDLNKRLTEVCSKIKEWNKVR